MKTDNRITTQSGSHDLQKWWVETLQKGMIREIYELSPQKRKFKKPKLKPRS